jgi:hypothetical protein
MMLNLGPKQEESTVKRKPGRPAKSTSGRWAKKPTGPKKKRGAPLKLNAEVTRKLCQHVKIGSDPATAAEAVGISKDTLHEWLKRGHQAIQSGTKDNRERMFARLVNALNRAAAEAELRDTKRIDRAGNFDWRALAWKMERRYPSWRLPSEHRHVHTGDKNADPIAVEYNVTELRQAANALPADTRKQILELLAEPDELTAEITSSTPAQLSSIIGPEIPQSSPLISPDESDERQNSAYHHPDEGKNSPIISPDEGKNSPIISPDDVKKRDEMP